MLKITRIYNQNRFKFWTIAIIVIFIIAIIQLYNNAYRNVDDKRIQENVISNNVQSNMVDYDKASETITNNGNVRGDIKNDIQRTLENFIIYCCNGQINEAYDFLTDDCKELLYPTKESFDNNYCKYIYEKRRTYSFQSWSTSENTYIYLVKIFEDMLSTGRDLTENYLQDYITVVKQDGEYLLNINKFIKTKKINREVEKQDVKIKINTSQVYMDYEVFNIQIKNNREKDIILDPLKEDESVYVLNQDLLKIRALLYENNENDFRIAPGEVKQITIKFNNAYINSNYINKVVFSSIIIDEEKYNKKSNDGQIEIGIDVKV